MKEEKVYNINPLIKAREANHFLKIHHDVKVDTMPNLSMNRMKTV